MSAIRHWTLAGLLAACLAVGAPLAIIALRLVVSILSFLWRLAFSPWPMA